MKKKFIFAAVFAICLLCIGRLNSPDTESLPCLRANAGDMHCTVRATGAIIAGDSGFYATTTIPERDIYKISEGSFAEITCIAVPAVTYRAYVTSIAGSARQSSSGYATVDISLELTDDTAYLKSGYTADIVIYGDTLENVISVPFEAVASKNGKNYVWVLRGGSMIPTEVETGMETEFETQIVSGIASGDVIAACPVWEPAETVRVKQ